MQAMFQLILTTLQDAPRVSSDLARSVDVRPVLDGHNGHLRGVVIDAVDDAVVAAASAVKPLKTELEWLTDAIRVLG